MVNLRSILSSTLKKKFRGATIYKERAEDMKKPAFFIHEIQSRLDKKLGNRYQRKHFYQIVYFPAEDDENISDYEKLGQVADILYDVLEMMEFKGEKVKGTNLKFRIEDNTLQFFADFITHYHRDLPKPLMEKLKEQTKRKPEKI